MPAESTADEMADELYALPPEQFVTARDERMRAAREAGDRDLATALARLRRPTTGAWVVNLLVRDQHDLLDELLSLGEELRAAQRELRGDALRELAVRRQRVVAALVQAARRLAADAGHPVSAGTAYEVEQTLHAALADPDVARTVAAGRLVHPQAPGGFGLDATAAPAERPERSRRPATQPKSAGTPASDRGPRADSAQPREGQSREQQAEDRRRVEQQRLQADHDTARADHEVAEAELRDAERQLAAVEAARDKATARIESLQEQLRTAQRDLHEASGPIRDARRRRDVAARVRAGTAERLARLADRLHRP